MKKNLAYKISLVMSYFKLFYTYNLIAYLPIFCHYCSCFLAVSQATLDGHLKTACDMTEVGETANRVENLIQEANDFEKLCNCDLDTASSVVEDGKYLKLPAYKDSTVEHRVFQITEF